MPKRAVTPPGGKKGHHVDQTAAASTPGGGSKAAETEHGSPRPSSPFPAISLRRTRFSSVPLVQLKHADTEEITFPASVELPRRHVTFYSDVDSDSSLSGGGLCSMSDTMESFKELGASPSTQPSVRIKHLTRNSDGTSRFPKLDECAHFHYDNVELGPINVVLSEGDDRVDGKSSCASEWWFCVQVTSNGKSWQVRRSLDNFQMLDRQLHRCVYDRKFSLLKEISVQPQQPEDALRTMLTQYLERFSQLAGSLINCGPVLNWLELDNRGNRLIVTDEAAINTPAVAAAYVIKRYASQASDEISLEVGDIISVIDMPPPEESSWWRGKKGFQVGFFPCECVEIIGDKVPQSIKIPKAPAKPVLRKHGKLIAFFRSFLLSRPSRRKLKQSGILKERVFGCDLGEHLMNTGRDIPLVLKCCTEFIEQHGIVDGIYRLSGVTSNIQKLRLAFDEDRVPNLMDEAIVQDIHCVASLLKMYFRELPNPLLTFHLYDKFVNAVQADEDMRLLKLRDVVQQLPPPHYRSLEYLMRHLSKVAAHGFQTGMTPKNVAIVWAPNLLRSRDIENGGVGALHVVGVQAVLTEYLIRYTDIIFSEKMPIFPSPVLGEETPKKTRPKSLAISTPTKLLSLEEARSRALTSNLPGEQQKFIDVGGGEENLPIKYHTVIELPVRRRSMGKGKKSPSGWRSFFSRGWHTTSGRRKSRRSGTEGQSERPKIGSPIFSEHSPLILQDKAVTESDVFHTDAKKLRSVKSAESLFPISSNLSQQITDYEFTPVDEIATSPPDSVDFDIAKEIAPSSFAKSTYQKHMRSTSHDSYFERLIDFQMDDELDLDEDSLLEMKPLQKPTSAVNQIRSLAVEEDICHAQSAKDSLGRNKTAHKQKLVSFDSEASSPKLQKLSLKRLYHTLSSPPMVKKKDFSKKEKNNENSEKQPLVQNELMIVDDNLALEKCRALKQSDSKVEFQKNEESDIVEQTSFSEQTRVPLRESLTCVSKLEQETEISALHEKDSVPVEIHREYQDLNMSHINEEENFEKLDQQSVAVSESQNASIHDDADDNAISFSVEATRSDSVSLSQLLSFDGDQVLSVGNSASKDKQLEHSVGLQNGSVTPESPTGDNVSEIPSSADSEAGDSASELGKQVAIESVLNEIQNNHLFNNTSCLCESDEKDDKITKQDENAEEKLANETELLQITNNVNITYKQKEETEAIFSPVPSEIGISQDTDRHLALDSNFVENIILSPPENFVDKSPTATVQKQNGSLASKLVNDIKTSAKSPGAKSLERSMTEVHEICPKFVSGIAVSGSLGHELFRANSEFVDSSLQKKRSCSDKLSPISPIEESRRKFESEIGRLIVRDRQMKLEMEQIKAERQRYKTEKSFSEIDKSRLKSEKKFVDALDFRKSPVKSFDSDRKKMDQDDILKSLRETADDKKTSEMAFTHGYSRYIRMENKPSVKELLSKFEGHKKQRDMCERTDSVASPKQSQSVFSNVQVINHNIPLTSSKSLSSSFADSNQSCKDNQISHTKEHIFQTECVVRFPHPKASFLTQDWNKNGSIDSDTYDSFGSRSWTSGQCDHRTKVNNSRTAFLSSDNLMTSSVQSNSYSSFSTSPFEGSSPQSLTTEQNNKSKNGESNWLSEQLYSGKSHQADHTGGSKMHQKYSESDENSFSSFQQTYTRPGSMTSKMRTEFLQQGISQPLCENGRSVLAPEKFNAFDGNHYSRSSFESRKRNSTSRQRPKSVPPPVCRLSFVSSTPYPPAQLTQACSISVSKQAETSPNNVPKTSSRNLSNGQESSDTSQTCGPSKRIRDRAAIFERSLSFSGYADKKPYSSSKHSQKAQANSSAR